MRKAPLLLLVLMAGNTAISQQKQSVSNKKQETNSLEEQEQHRVFTKVEISAGTDQRKWKQYLQKALELPDSLKQKIPPGTYKVQIHFLVDQHGYMGQVKALNDPGFGLAERAVKILKSYSDSWQPATQCGRAVKSYQQQSLLFVIEDNRSGDERMQDSTIIRKGFERF
jgi:anti-sigma28 factor (negative regulator of flagellin synthesis)